MPAAIGGVIAGRLVERIDARIVIAAGATIGALALASVGWLREPWQLYVFHVVFGLCHGASGLVPLTTLVARWFSARRALAFSIASTGLSFGGIVVAPVVALLIERLGLAGAAPWMGLALCLGTLPVTLIVLRPRPAAMGLEPDGAVAVEGAPIAPQPAVAFGEARRSRYFYRRLRRLSVPARRAGRGDRPLLPAGEHAHGRGHRGAGALRARRLEHGRTACRRLAHALGSLARLCARPDGRCRRRGWRCWRSRRTRSSILAGTVLFGVTMGNSLMMHPLLLAERFGTRDYGRIYSTSQLVTVVGVAGCPPLIGLLYEASGGYTVPFLAVAALTLVGLAVLAIFGAPRR